MPTTFLSYRAILQKTWPIILANSSVPLLALADTAIIGNLGTTNDLGAIAFGSLIFSFLYWSFGFLRMGTTGFTAQAAGAQNESEIRNVLWRALAIASVIGCAIIILQWPLRLGALTLLQGDDEVEQLTAAYFSIRVWGAPATLCTFALMGTLIGLGKSRTLLALQLLLNGSNIALDILFAGVMEMGAAGIALGTCIAEWTTVIVGTLVVYRSLQQRKTDHTPFISLSAIFAKGAFSKTISANTDILIRTLLMLLCFYWFTNSSARFGTEVLAANHILLQLISFSAFFLDGFAFVAEALVGRAIGGNSRQDFNVAVKRTSVLAAITAVGLTFIILFTGHPIIDALTNLENVRQPSKAFLIYAAAYVFLSVGAFQLDGIFIGATRTREMRNASVQAASLFLIASLVLTHYYGTDGLWLAFIFYVLMRAVTLLGYLPRVVRDITGP